MKNLILKHYSLDNSFIFKLNQFEPQLIRLFFHLEMIENELESKICMIFYTKLNEPLRKLNNSIKRRKKRNILRETACSIILIFITRNNPLLGFTINTLRIITKKKNKNNLTEYGIFWTETINEQGGIETIYNKKNILLSSAVISAVLGTSIFFFLNSFSEGPRTIIRPGLTFIEPILNTCPVPPMDLFKIINSSLNEANALMQNLEVHQFYDVPSLKIKVSILEAVLPIYKESYFVAEEYYSFLISKNYGNSFLFNLKVLNDLLQKSCKTDNLTNTFCQQIANEVFQK